MRYLSCFSGVGGMDLGFDRAGWTCVGQVEIDKNARAVLEKHWPDVPKHDDITTAKGWVDERGLVGRVDVVAGGAPCQDLSIAGARAGFGGDRSRLVLDMVALAAHVEAGILIYENVPGLLSSNQGRDFGVLLTVLAEAGYGHIEWRMLDSQHFGVPQRRKRVFLVASATGFGGREVLSEREGLRWHPEEGTEAGPDTAGAVAGGARSGGVVNALTRNGLGGGGADDNLAQGGHLVAVSSSSVQTVTSAITTGTGIRYDPDTESLVVQRVQ